MIFSIEKNCLSMLSVNFVERSINLAILFGRLHCNICNLCTVIGYYTIFIAAWQDIICNLNADVCRALSFLRSARKAFNLSKYVISTKWAVHILLEQQKNFPQIKRNESDTIPNSLPNNLIKFLSKLWGSLHLCDSFLVIPHPHAMVPK